MTINTEGLEFKADGDVTLTGCLGQRFICAGMSDVSVTVEGTPGNALGAYLNGADITVLGNAQDAVGDTMNSGIIAVHGNIGDAAGYAMRGGCIYVKGNAGYRAGIHMKAYKEKVPVMVIGGCTGSFLGEYQAGGVIVVLGLEAAGRRIVGNFPAPVCTAGRCSCGRTAATLYSRSRSRPAPRRRTTLRKSKNTWRNTAACSARTKRT